MIYMEQLTSQFGQSRTVDPRWDDNVLHCQHGVGALVGGTSQLHSPWVHWVTLRKLWAFLVSLHAHDCTSARWTETWPWTGHHHRGQEMFGPVAHLWLPVGTSSLSSPCKRHTLKNLHTCTWGRCCCHSMFACHHSHFLALAVLQEIGVMHLWLIKQTLTQARLGVPVTTGHASTMEK